MSTSTENTSLGLALRAAGEPRVLVRVEEEREAWGLLAESGHSHESVPPVALVGEYAGVARMAIIYMTMEKTTSLDHLGIAISDRSAIAVIGSQASIIAASVIGRVLRLPELLGGAPGLHRRSRPWAGEAGPCERADILHGLALRPPSRQDRPT